MVSVGVVIGAVIFGLLALVPSVPGLYWLYRILNIRSISARKIGDLKEGPVQVTGKAVPIKTLESPAMSSQCVYFKLRVQEASGVRKDNWHTIYNKGSDSEFFISDDTGQTKVVPPRARMYLDHSYHDLVGESIYPPDSIHRFLTKEGAFNGVLSFFGGMDHYVRMTEWIIKPNQQIYVVATAKKDPAGDYFQLAKGKGLFLISDKPRGAVLKEFAARTFVFFLIAGALFLLAGGFLFIGFLI